MRPFKTHRYVVAAIVGTICGSYFFFGDIANSNQVLLDELTLSVSGNIKSIVICRTFSTKISQNCYYMNEILEKKFVTDVRQAKKSLRPGHSNTINRYFIKIEAHKKVNCFVVDEIKGVSDLYFSRIDAGENCEDTYFKYLSGSARSANFFKNKHRDTLNLQNNLAAPKPHQSN